MRILLSIENEEKLDNLKSNLCGLLKMIDDKEVLIDVFHVHDEPEIKRAKGHEELVGDILKREHKAKLRMIAHCENEIEAHLNEHLDIGVLVNSHMITGDFRDKLKEHIKFHKYDLLILNPSKKTNFELIMKGRHTHWIIDNLEIPILILPVNLTFDCNDQSHVTSFVESVSSFEKLNNSELFQLFKKDTIEYIHFGRESIHDDVNLVNCSDPIKSIDSYLSAHSNNLYVIQHFNKGDYLNFLDKSFTKAVIKNMVNPLLVF